MSAVLWVAGVSSAAAQAPTGLFDGTAGHYYLFLDITGAQTQIDVEHTTSWNINVASGQTLQLYGGAFVMKKGADATADVVLTLRNSGPGGSVIATKTRTSSAFTGTFADVLFAFDTAQTLNPGRYYVTLTSAASLSGAAQYFIKGATSPGLGDGVTDVPSSTATTAASPETQNFTLVKTATTSVAASASLTYTLQLGNDGGSPSGTSATVKDQLPAGVVATAATAGTGVTSVNCGSLPSSAAALLTCTVTLSSSLATASAPSATFTITATAPSSAGSITNYASVDGTGGVSPATPSSTCLTSSCSSASTTVTGGASSFTLAKTATSPVVTGGTITYTLKLGNNGGVTSGTSATVDDQLPTGATATAATAGTGVTSVTCTNLNVASAKLTCTVTLAAGIAASTAASSGPAFTITVTAPSSAGAITNYASVDPTGGASPPTPSSSCATANCASAPTTVQLPPDMTIALSHVGSFTQGQTGAQYTAVVTNSGATSSSGTVTMTSTLPAGLTPTAAAGSGWTCTVAGSTVTCTRADALAAGQSYPAITITTNVSNTATNLVTAASVSGGGETNTANNTASDPTTVGGGPDMFLRKQHAGDFTPGQIGAVYTIYARNGGNGPTTAPVTVVDNLPAGLAPASAAGSGWSCTISGQAVTCTRSDVLEPGAFYPEVEIRVNVAATASGSVINTASVSGGGDVNSDNNSVSDPTTIAAGPDLAISLSRSGALAPGATLLYTINSVNVGTGPTTGEVTVVPQIPAGSTLLSIGGDGWSCSTSPLQCRRTDILSPGGSYPPITLAVTLPSTFSGAVATTTTISTRGDTNAGNNSASDSGQITSSPDLTLRKSHTGNFSQGQVGATYSLVVTNSGAAATSAPVTVRDSLPSGLTATGLSGSGWSCGLSPLECSRTDALPAGSSYPAITLTVSVAATAPASVTNSASVSGGGESNTGNNSASDLTAIITQVPDVTITLSHTGDLVRGQVNGLYTMTVS
ncbi:MAG: hypothetical protein RJA55_1091, partial [Acidobacteriota bacterium]